MGGFDSTGTKVAFTVDCTQTPGDVWVHDLQSGITEQWTFSETGSLPIQSFVSPWRLHYPTFDCVGPENAPRKIPAWVYMPSEQHQRPVAVVIYIHGGPASQIHPTFKPANHPQSNQVLLESGIAVIAPDVRGSTGYGKSYVRLDDWELREDSVKDIGALLDWIDTEPDFDSSRICVMGRSYGGYMTLACMVIRHIG